MRIVKKTVERRKCTVHDLQVETSHTYNVEGLAVHNSSAGSLVNYLLGITQIDPIKHGLIFERFMNRHRCLDENLFVAVEDGSFKRLKDIKVGDFVWTGTDYSRVTDTVVNDTETVVAEFRISGKVYTSSLSHRWPIVKDDHIVLKYSFDVREGDYIAGLSFAPNSVEAVSRVFKQSRLIDITIDHPLHMFAISTNCNDWILTHNSDMPDIDCLDVNHLVVMWDGSHKKISDVVVGDVVLDYMGNQQRVKHIWPREYWPGEKIYDVVVSLNGVYGSITCVGRHKFIDIDGKIKHAQDLKVYDLLHSIYGHVRVEAVLINEEPEVHRFVDIEVEGSHTFQVIPFDIDVEDNEYVMVHANLLRTYIQE